MSALLAVHDDGFHDDDWPVILMVDDELRIRRATAQVLSDANFTVHQAGNADEALQLLRSGLAIDVVVTDVRMPGSMDGVALAGVIKTEFPGMIVIVTSGYELKGARDGVDDFLLKPVHPAELVRRVGALISRVAAS